MLSLLFKPLNDRSEEHGVTGRVQIISRRTLMLGNIYEASGKAKDLWVWKKNHALFSGLPIVHADNEAHFEDYHDEEDQLHTYLLVYKPLGICLLSLWQG